MSDPGYRIRDFFNRMSSVKNTTDFNTFMAEYWYVWFIISLIIVIMIVINILLCVYFRRRAKSKDDTFKYKKIVQDAKANTNKTVLIQQKPNYNPILQRVGVKQLGQDFINEALLANNRYRALHNAPPLVHNPALSKIAQKWADMLGKTNKLEHSPLEWRKYNNTPLGENICYSMNVTLTGDSMIEMWYAESSKHDYSADSQQQSSNFSQLVWKGSKEVGYGRIKITPGNSWYGVAVYMPAGNVLGHYGANVNPPTI